MRAALLFLLLGTFALARPVSAQSSALGPAPSILFRAGRSVPQFQVEVADTNTPSSHPTYWKEGALIGGVVGAAVGVLVFHDLCSTSDDADKNCTLMSVGGALTGALVLGIPGALIGGAFPKGGNSESR